MKTKHLLSSLALGLALTLALLWLLNSAPGAPIRSVYALGSTFTVTGTHDTGDGSLREAINDANADADHDVIDFHSDVSGTITLTSGQLTINEEVTISGPGAEQLAVSGGGSTRVFSITSRASVTITGLTVRDGSAGDGGGIWCGGNLHLDSVRIVSNTARGLGGGGVCVEGENARFHARGGRIASNEAADNTDGGGVFVWNASATLTGTEVISNTADSRGGGG